MAKPTYRNGKEPAKKRAEENLGISRRNHRWFAPVLAELRKIYPRKLAVELALIANRSPRVCEDWISTPPRGAPDGEALAALLTNKHHGKRLMAALARSSGHAWAEELDREIQRTNLRAQIRADQRRLASLEAEDL